LFQHPYIWDEVKGSGNHVIGRKDDEKGFGGYMLRKRNVAQVF
jgi:hypothetical protein